MVKMYSNRTETETETKLRIEVGMQTKLRVRGLGWGVLDGGCKVIGWLVYGDSGTCPGAWD